MALPPVAAAAPAPGEAEVVAADAPVDVMDDGAGEEECIATICRTPDGTYVLYAGDEPEDGVEAEGMSFEDGPSLLRGVMELLNSDSGAEESFGKGFRGEPDVAAEKPVPPMA